jgi:CubicO group peptidase (beta-lactamase class C family)
MLILEPKGMLAVLLALLLARASRGRFVMKRSSRIASLTLILLLAASTWAANGTPTARAASPSAGAATLAARIDAYVKAQAALPVTKAFSGTVLVSQNGKVIINKGYGLADREHRIPHTPNTTFQIASISKEFAAAAILILQQRHKLSVHDRICTYIPGCPTSWRPITIHMLLTHTSGIGHWDTYVALDSTPMSLDQLIGLFERMPPLFKPGTQYSYSSPGYTLLAYIVQKVSGEPYATFMQQNIFRPLGMTRSKVDDNNDPPASHAVGYIGPYPYSYPSLIGVFGSGDIWTTTGDLERWDRSFSTTRILSKASQKAMFTPWVMVPGGGGAEWYGYGWQIEYGLHLMIYHGGGNPGFYTYNRTFPNDKVDVIVLTNNEVDQSALVTEIELMALGMG